MIIFILYISLKSIPLLNYYYDQILSSPIMSGVFVISSAIFFMSMLFSKNRFFRKILCIEFTSFFYENLLSIYKDSSIGWLVGFILAILFIEKFTRPISIREKGGKC